MLVLHDFLISLQWLTTIFIIGATFLPLTFFIFKPFKDGGYIFSKIIGIGIFSYLFFVLNVFRIIQFNTTFLYIVFLLLIILNFVIFKTGNYKKLIQKWKIIALEEGIFFLSFLLWSAVRGFQPDIQGLEKFMDFGFINSILRSSYLPAPDIWLTPHSINYYYFGHFITALLTKFSQVGSSYSFNFMVATIFSISLTSLFSLGINLFSKEKIDRRILTAGILTPVITIFSGNLHTIYSFFSSYSTDAPLPFWKLILSLQSFPNNYWYPNATRFIPFTIHEFPAYSFIVSDLHAHLLTLPFVILFIALMLLYFNSKKPNTLLIIFASFLTSIMYMTNSWDVLVYTILFSGIVFVKNYTRKNLNILKSSKTLLIFMAFFLIFIIPFSINFSPFASGIGVICSPNFLINMGTFGPFLFEANHCQRSPLWQMLILYGFFYFFVISFILFLVKQKVKAITKSDVFILILGFVSTILIIIPEFIYVKDIYPAHYRANTMFKLTYQAFILLSIVSSYSIVRILGKTKNIVFYIIATILLSLVLVYSYFGISGYYSFQKYKGVDGTTYLKTLYPQDYNAIKWINKNIEGQPVMLEAQGDSYSYFERISANTGLPTVIGWGTHEWLWRGSYEVVAPRIEDVQNVYEGADLTTIRKIIKKYKISYIYIGELEFKKYKIINISKFNSLGKLIYQENNTYIFKTF